MQLVKDDKDAVNELQQQNEDMNENPRQISMNETTNNTNNNDNFSHQLILNNNKNNVSHQLILNLANQSVTSPSNCVERNQNYLALKAFANSNVTSLPPQVGKGQLTCPHVWIDNCPTKSGKALQLLKWRGMSQYQQEFLSGIALAYGGETADK